jgi:hypothetical protein
MAKAELGVLLQDLRGKAGNVVFQKSRDGLVVKPRVKGTNPRTPAQLAVRSYLTRAAQAYQALTPTQALAWRNYASTQVKRNPVSGKTYNPTAMNAFTELASKFLQISPTGTIPLTPPANPFYGDTITVTATAATGKVTFTASAANASNVKTEFLLQPLKNANRKPNAKGYRTKGFFAYIAGTLTYDVIVPSGYYAAAYRFVNSQTGQQTEPVYLAVQQVTFSVSSGTKGSKSETAKAA